MSRIISVSLFDDMNRYQPYLPPALRAHHNLFQGWVYRIYHDHRIDNGPYGRALRALEKRGLVELVFVTDKVMIEKAMLWRLLPLWDSDVELFEIRDVDMVASYRERRAVEEWIRSTLAVHSMSDLPGHHNWPAINGMMGFRVSDTRNLLNAGPGFRDATIENLFARAGWSDEIWSSNYRASATRSADPRYRMSPDTTNNQYFLGTHVWPRVKRGALEHRLNGCHTYPDTGRSLTTIDPFENEDLGVSGPVMAGSDSIIPFIGASKVNSDIDLDAVLTFHKENGDPAIEQIFMECEEA